MGYIIGYIGDFFQSLDVSPTWPRSGATKTPSLRSPTLYKTELSMLEAIGSGSGLQVG